MKRIAALAGCLAALIVPAAALAATTPPLKISALHVARLVTCPHLGVRGPTGKVSARLYVVKGGKATRSRETCARARAVIVAGRGDMYGNLRRSVDKAVGVAGGSYFVNEAIVPGRSGLAPAFVGGGTVIVAIYARGR